VQETDGNILREEELELVVGELAQLRTEHIVDADVVCIAPAIVAASVKAYCMSWGATQLTQDRRQPTTGPC
jgi:hypothetical protein